MGPRRCARGTGQACRRRGLALHAVDTAQPPRSPRTGRFRAQDDASLRAVRRQRPVTLVPLTVLLLTSILLFAVGFNLLYLSWRAIHLPSPHGPGLANRSEPVVCVQIPIYNERYVAERVIDA